LAQEENRPPEPAAENEETVPPRRRAAQKSAESQQLARAFSSALGLAVSHSARGEAGEIRIRYSSPDELDGLRRRLGIDT
jgi:ParB family transcriptional regulator, chromosome partitioning protein